MSIHFELDWRIWGLGVILDLEEGFMVSFGPLHMIVEPNIL
jgi:hypothetical protein